MDSLNPASPPPLVVSAERPPRIWKFWGTALWGLFIFAGMFVGQAAVIVYFLLRQEGPIDLAAMTHFVSGGLTISLSVITGLPAVLLAAWVATHFSRTSFVDYLALRWTSWQNFVIGAVSLAVLVGGWDLLSRAIGAATQNAITNTHSAPSACADFSTSPMKPGVTSRPSARDSRSQPPTSTANETAPIRKFCHEVQRSAR